MQIPFVDLSREATMLSDEIKNEVDLDQVTLLMVLK